MSTIACVCASTSTFTKDPSCLSPSTVMRKVSGMRYTEKLPSVTCTQIHRLRMASWRAFGIDVCALLDSAAATHPARRNTCEPCAMPGVGVQRADIRRRVHTSPTVREQPSTAMNPFFRTYFIHVASRISNSSLTSSPLLLAETILAVVCTCPETLWPPISSPTRADRSKLTLEPCRS